MNGGQACRQIEESAWEAGPPSIPELDAQSPVPESATRLLRSSVETMPTSDPCPAPSGGRPDWCVDMGETLLSMTTFELWSAIESGTVSPWVRVWREGIECWTPVGELPELRWAVACAPAAHRPTAEEEPLEVMPDPTPADATTGPIAQPAVTPEPRPTADLPARAASRRSSELEVTPAPTTQPSASLEPASRTTRWYFAGSAVAALAIVAALLRVATQPTLAPADAPAAALVAVRPGADTTPPSAHETSPVTEPSLAEPPDPAATPAVRREERGQRRQSRGGRRAYGR